MATTTSGRATDFITFSRPGATGGGATVTDRDGKIKWAGHNLLTNSESFDASSWTKNAVTVVANSVAAPNGTTTADTATETAAPDLHAAFQSVDLIAGGVTYTFTVFAKANTRTHAMLRIGGGSFGTGPAIRASLSGSGSVTTLAGTVASSSISLVGDGWYLISMTFASGSVAAHLPQCGPHDGGSATTYTGDITKSVYLWGAHLYRSDLGGMVLNPARGDAYYPTTPRNLLGFTEDFSNAAWPNLNLSVTTNSAVAPNGLQTADALFETTTTGRHRFRQAISVAPASSTVSVYAKANGRNFISINIDDGNTQYAVFNLATGAVGVTGGGAVAHTPVSAGDGWWRCAVTFTSLSTNGPFIHLRDTNSQPADYAGDVTKGVYLWGAQLSDSASLDAYSPVYGAAVTSAAYYAPRLDYSGSSLAALGLLVEEQRSNLITYSQDLTQWSNASTSDALNAIGPDGTTSATTVTNTASGNASILRTVDQPTGVQTLSVYVKQGTSAKVSITAQYGGLSNWAEATLTFAGLTVATSSGGTGYSGLSADVQAAGNGWYRLRLTYTLAAGVTDSVRFFVGGWAAAINGETAIFYGAQLEAGSFSTSLIPTGASTATRTADVASVSTQAFPYSASEGTLVGEVRGLLSNTITQVPLVSFGDANNRIELRAVGDPFTYNRAVVVNSGSTVVDINATGLPASASATRKVGFAFKLNDFATTGTGGTVGTTSSGTIPSVSVMNIGTAPYSASLKTNGWIATITYIPRRLSNSELQARTV